ncbi:MAG: endonuclease III [Deltaproteobacteria bacterium]|nr:endonuclease III [Deltaproteobacteria bacterium]
MDDRERLERVDGVLAALYPEQPALDFSSPFTLLVAAILAAQCTDERVNQVTRELFRRYDGPRAFAEAPLDELEQAIHSTGFFRQKARTLQACCRALAERFGGEVPADAALLTELPGIGRKTANLVLGNSLGVPAVFVDTHVKRVAYRLGFTSRTDPDRIEEDLTPLLPPERRAPFSNLLTHLGRAVCTARKPRCPECPVRDLCPKVGV